jgi:hypothetical protein
MAVNLEVIWVRRQAKNSEKQKYFLHRARRAKNTGAREGVRGLAGVARGSASNRRVSNERPEIVQPVGQFAEVIHFQFQAGPK